MIEITKAEYQNDFKIWVKFNDDTEGIADLRDDLWGNVFEPLKNLDLFRKFSVSEIMNTIEWENGADVAPEFLYDKIKKHSNSKNSSENNYKKAQDIMGKYVPAGTKLSDEITSDRRKEFERE